MPKSSIGRVAGQSSYNVRNLERVRLRRERGGLDSLVAENAPKVRNEDRRVIRTRGAIVDSFNHLVRQRSYRSIQVPDILDEAGVGRSTFYEHFKNKDALLLQSASRFFEVLADAVNPECDPCTLAHVVAHFSQVRRMAKDILASPAFDSIANDIASRIREKLRTRVANAAPSNLALVNLGATQIAHAELALVREWLHALEPCSPEQLASLLHQTSMSMADAIVRAK